MWPPLLASSRAARSSTAPTGTATWLSRSAMRGVRRSALGECFEPDALDTNLAAVVGEIVRAKPSTSKGKYLKKVALSSTMGPSVRVDTGAYDTK